MQLEPCFAVVDAPFSVSERGRLHCVQGSQHSSFLPVPLECEYVKAESSSSRRASNQDSPAEDCCVDGHAQQVNTPHSMLLLLCLLQHTQKASLVSEDGVLCSSFLLKKRCFAFFCCFCRCPVCRGSWCTVDCCT